MNEKKQQIIEDYKQGLSTKKIRAKYGIGNGTLYGVLEEAQISRKSSKEKNYPSKEEFEEYYVTQNHSFKNTKEHFGLSTKIFYKLVEEYGIEKSDEAKMQRTRQTMLERYGVENPNQSKEIREKIHQTCLERYGSISPMGNKEVQDKTHKTFEEKYGCHPRSTKEVQDKQKQTCLEKYGVDNAAKAQEIRDKISKSVELANQSGLPRKKAMSTCLERYDCAHYNQQYLSDKAKQVLIGKESFEEYILSLPEKNRTKHYIAHDLDIPTYSLATRIKKFKLEHLIRYKPHQSFPESLSYDLLVEKFGEKDVLQQYRSSNYPFFCDFYVKSLDIFIEGQYSCFHGKEPYDPNNPNHLKIVEKLCQKHLSSNNKWYGRIVKVWTVRDPLKRSIAKKNNLNWLEFFTVDQLREWLNTI